MLDTGPLEGAGFFLARMPCTMTHGRSCYEVSAGAVLSGAGGWYTLGL